MQNTKAHLFFDVFIEDAVPGVYTRGHKERFEEDYKIRTASDAYKFQTKFDITRYSIDSYSYLDWESATFRIECENKDHEKIYDEIKAKFPQASIEKKRSATAKEYCQALQKSNIPNDDWVFFSPNNDHPLIGNGSLINNLIQDAEYAEENYPNDFTTISFSHFTEALNMRDFSCHEWGSYGNVFAKVIRETDYSYTLQLNKLALDSLHIYTKKALLKIFCKSKVTSKVIRPEDTEFYLNEGIHLLIIPKAEICAHYDGYMHINHKVPPLFIPDGFFEGKIKIRYGYTDTKKGWVNINPSSKYFSYQNNNAGADLKITLEELPIFWRSRISVIDKNPAFIDIPTPFQYKDDLFNPWRDVSKIRILIRNTIKFIKFKIKSTRGRL